MFFFKNVTALSAIPRLMPGAARSQNTAKSQFYFTFIHNGPNPLIPFGFFPHHHALGWFINKG